MKKHIVLIPFYFAALVMVMEILLMFSLSSAFGNEREELFREGPFIEIPSSFNPVGSGARAIGMGGAFIAVADDATAATWNPGGLIQLKSEKPELSLVISGFKRQEDNNFGTHPEASGLNSIFDGNINYFSIAGSFELLNRNMSVALTYQHLYDFNREWAFVFRENTPIESYESDWNYQQDGRLSALGLSYCIQVIPQLSLGFTLNFWEEGITDNKWEQNYRIIRTGTSFTNDINKTEEYSFSGFNMNVGMLYTINKKLTIGAVFKTPFKADVEHKLRENWVINDSLSLEPHRSGSDSDTRNEELEMPMSYGIGFVYNFSDDFSISADIYRTEWDDFIYKNKYGRETNPVTGLSVSQSDTDPTHQMRIGAEYLFLNKKKRYVIPLRAGIFYDPAPAKGSPDDYYGFSFGSGFSKIDWFSLDIAYQYRFGNDIGASFLEDLQFSQDIHEHMIYISMILYRF